MSSTFQTLKTLVSKAIPDRHYYNSSTEWNWKRWLPKVWFFPCIFPFSVLLTFFKYMEHGVAATVAKAKSLNLWDLLNLRWKQAFVVQLSQMCSPEYWRKALAFPAKRKEKKMCWNTKNSNYVLGLVCNKKNPSMQQLTWPSLFQGSACVQTACTSLTRVCTVKDQALADWTGSVEQCLQGDEPERCITESWKTLKLTEATRSNVRY